MGITKNIWCIKDLRANYINLSLGLLILHMHPLLFFHISLTFPPLTPLANVCIFCIKPKNALSLFPTDLWNNQALMLSAEGRVTPHRGHSSAMSQGSTAPPARASPALIARSSMNLWCSSTTRNHWACYSVTAAIDVPASNDNTHKFVMGMAAYEAPQMWSMVVQIQSG